MLLVGVLYLTWPAAQPELELDWQGRLEQGDHAVDTIEFVQYGEAGELLWKVQAAGGVHEPEGARTILHHIVAWRFHGEAEDKLKANEAIIADGSEVLDLEGEVQVHFAKAGTLDTSHLRYDPTSHVVHTDADVQFAGEGLRLRGTGLWVDLQKKTMELKHNVESHYE